MKKRPTWLLLPVLLLALVWLLWGGQNHIETETFVLSTPNLPAVFDGLRIAQVSDLHGKEFGPDNRDLLAALAALEPDLIAVTGDLIDQPEQLDMVTPLARALSAIAPTYYVTGNHEWAIREAGTVKELLREGGVTPLSNEAISLERDGETLILAGIDDPNGPYDQKTPEALAEEVRTRYGEGFLLLLAHRNEYYEVYDRAGYDLTLCGHGHGGLIRLPFTDGLVGPRRQLFPDHTAGVYDMEYGRLLVSRGLGNVGRTLRLFNRPHLPLVVLRTAI